MSQVVISNKVLVGPDRDYDDILTLHGPSGGWVAIGTSYKAYQSAACTAVRPDGFTPYTVGDKKPNRYLSGSCVAHFA